MTREQLKALGLSDEQIDSIMGMHGKATQGLQAQLATQKVVLEKAQNDLAELMKKTNDKKEVEPPAPEVSPEVKDLQDQIAKLQAENRIKDLRAYCTDKKIPGEQSEAIIKAFGDNLEVGKAAIDSIATIISQTTETVKKTVEQNLLNKTPNPQGSAGASTQEDKPDDVKNAESISFATVDKDAKSAQDYYS